MTAAGNDLTHNVDTVPLTGEFLADPNEFTVWGERGPRLSRHNLDGGDVGTTSINNLAGGLIYSYPVIVEHVFGICRATSGNIGDIGFRMVHGQPNIQSTAARPVEDIFNEVAANGGTGPRVFDNDQVQRFDIRPDRQIVPAFNVITFGIEMPTGANTNHYVQFMASSILIRRVQ